MNLTRKTMYKFFDLPFHERIEIAKKFEIFNGADLKMKPLEATQKWGKQIVDEKLVDQLNNFINPKEICLECSYWDKSQKRGYKCYAGNCPAKLRDSKPKIFKK